VPLDMKIVHQQAYRDRHSREPETEILRTRTMLFSLEMKDNDYILKRQKLLSALHLIFQKSVFVIPCGRRTGGAQL